MRDERFSAMYILITDTNKNLKFVKFIKSSITAVKLNLF